jgi:hypothetical protein
MSYTNKEAEKFYDCKTPCTDKGHTVCILEKQRKGTCPKDQKQKTKYYLIKIEIRNGERSYTETILQKIDSTTEKTPEEIGKDYLKDFYGEEDTRTCTWMDKEDCYVENIGTSEIARVYDVKELTEIEYIVLNKFFYSPV